ncbi:MAG: hypothetical protein GF320_05975, partial [Armatimonadia bacterium]|nr:hypothetical protein [Armatimonadia bacterium]
TKKLLDGTGAALVSTDSANLTPMITGDVVNEANYRLETQVTPGQGQVLKSDIFRVVAGEQYARGNRGMAQDIDPGTLVTGGRALNASDFTLWQDLDWTVAPDAAAAPGSPNANQDFQITYTEGDPAAAATPGDLLAVTDFHLGSIYNGFTIDGTAGLNSDDTTNGAPYVVMEVLGLRADDTVAATAPDTIDGDRMTLNTGLGAGAQLITLRVSTYSRDGDLKQQSDFEIDSVDWTTGGGVDILSGAGYANLGSYTGTLIQMGSDGDQVTVGDKVVVLYDNEGQYGFNGLVQAAQDDNAAGILADNGNYSIADGAAVALTLDLGGTAAGDEVNRVGARLSAPVLPDSLPGLTLSQSIGWLDGDGNFHMATGDFRFGDNTTTFPAAGGPGTSYQTNFNMFETTLAERVTELQWIDRFQSGISLFETGSQSMTLYANGERADIVLQGRDSLDDLAAKLRKAITTSVLDGGLGMGMDGDLSSSGVDGNTAVYVSQATNNTDEAVEGTLVLRSPLPGDDGRYFFSGDERLLNAFSWAEVVTPTESTADISVYDAHTGEFIDRQIVNDGVLRGVISGVEVKIDASEDVAVSWDAIEKRYSFQSDFGAQVGNVHVVANPLTLQVGANPGQKVDALIGEVTRSSLELENVLLVNRAVAEEAIPIVDKAIEEVSSQRARIGAYINRLNATINILDITAENLSASESRIRDLDMASQTIDFTRDQMLVQAATAMLAQANTLPQSVLTLLR